MYTFTLGKTSVLFSLHFEEVDLRWINYLVEVVFALVIWLYLQYDCTWPMHTVLSMEIQKGLHLLQLCFCTANFSPLLCLPAGRKREWFKIDDAIKVLQYHKPVQASYFETLRQGYLANNGTPVVTTSFSKESALSDIRWLKISS